MCKKQFVKKFNIFEKNVHKRRFIDSENVYVLFIFINLAVININIFVLNFNSVSINTNLSENDFSKYYTLSVLNYAHFFSVNLKKKKLKMTNVVGWGRGEGVKNKKSKHRNPSLKTCRK